ncbi:MAG: redoxin domain-containing protein [Nitriliruptorales bacterium]|nr:redoxin domain-containing protein [Nitriliruptorales bacterium]
MGRQATARYRDLMDTTDRQRGLRRTVLLAGALVVLLLSGALAVVALDQGRQPAEPPADGGLSLLEERLPPDRQAPLPDGPLDGFAGGAAVDLAAYRGQPLVVNLWATWCAPCVEEMPDLQEVAGQSEGRVAFLGVNVADGARRAQRFAEEVGVTYDLAADPDRRFFEAVQAFGMPTTLFVSPEGTIVYRQTGPLDADGLRAALSTHLGVDV